MVWGITEAQLKEVLGRSSWDVEVAADFLLAAQNVTHSAATPTGYAKAVAQHLYKDEIADRFSSADDRCKTTFKSTRAHCMEHDFLGFGELYEGLQGQAQCSSRQGAV